MALYHLTTRPLSRSSRNTVDALAYRAGCKLYDLRTGESFDYRNKLVQHVELLLPQGAPQWAKDIQELIKVNRQEGVQALCDRMEAAEKRIDARIWREFEFSLHRELTEEQNMTLAREFAKDQLCIRGMLPLLNFHFEIDKKTGEYNPHCHVVIPTRRLEDHESSPTGFSAKKERDWDKKDFLFELREQWAHYSNFYLKLYGHDVQIDHRSNKERGIEMEPQPKRGRNVLELERKATEAKTIETNTKSEDIENINKGNLELTALPESEKSVHPLEALKSDESTKMAPLTEKMQAFRAAQLRNLYRIMRNPNVILDIVTKHHVTFMWADVQKKLHQYVDNPVLFERLESKIKASSELVLLRVHKVCDSSGMEGDKAIYTTRSMLKAERSLIEQAEELGNSKAHGVQGKNIESAIAKANEKLKEHGRLSLDQIKAIHHLVEEGQIKCVVGIAGAGKTTAIGVCHEIWKAEGYAVYGIAPTGKASQNLEGSSLEDNGISSTTLHKFLKSFEEGRCQYNEKSILVLDEAGMVDVERFDKLLGAVKQLGVKLIVVGDGAQLQPVEAGPAFRLVTEKLGRSELNTVVRQKEEWQREATVLFGQQKTAEAIQKYEEKGCVHIIEEKLPSLKEAINARDYDSIVHLYEVSHRVSSLIYREMAKDVQKEYPELKKLYPKIREHEDFGKYLDWRDTEKDAADTILLNAQKCLPVLEAKNVDTLQLALVFKDPQKDKFVQQEEAKTVLKECGLDHLIGQTKKRGPQGQTVDVRQTAKEELIREWHTTFKENPEKSAAILAYSNKDVTDLNRQVRGLLKESGHLSKGEFIFKIKKEIEDDFGKKHTLKERKGFSRGDRIVFTKNKYWAGVRNGTMGTIIDINNRNIKVKLDEGKEISFSPNLNPHFDQGWAITIHKSQGTTFDLSFILASFEMTQNLVYVAMTRHREWVKMFGSSLDFWRKEKLPEILSKSGEKLSAADYLDAKTLTKIMKRDNQILTKFFQRMSNELEAMEAVTKEAFWNVADHFLGRTRQKEIRVLQDSVREEVRAEELFKNENTPINVVHSHPLTKNTNIPLKTPKKTIEQEVITYRPRKRELVENALKENMADFADHIFASFGEDYNRAMSSKIERRYGKKGEFSVNLQKGVWCSYKDSQLAGGPLHLLTKLKNLSTKEAINYGASWARLSPEQLTSQKKNYDFSYSQKRAQETAEKEKNAIRQKIKQAQSYWAKGQPLQGTLAERYLREHRNIKGDLPKSFLYLPPYSVGKISHPCLMAAVYSKEGEITAVQLTFLDPITATKANISVPKKSFGLLKGSSVLIQENKQAPDTLFIAEGLETALSLKEAGVQGTIKATLGLSNIKRLELQHLTTHIVICADCDAPNSPATRSLEKTVKFLQEKGLKVTIIKPDKMGEDFNDVLKTKGPEGIREVFAKNLPKGLAFSLIHNDAEKLPQKNSITRIDSKQSFKNTPHTQEFTLTNKSFQEIVAHCEKRLHDALTRDKKPLTQERRERFPLQAEKTATFLIHEYGNNRHHPTQEELALFSLRAKYELSRIPEIRKQLIREWKDKESFKEGEGLLAHMIAERLASIEGRLYLEAKQNGTKAPSNIAELARQELKEHRAQTSKLALELSPEYSLSKDIATHCAKDILRYKEIHGELPSKNQAAKIVQISRTLETQGYANILKMSLNRFEVDFLCRYKGDLLFKHVSLQEQSLTEVNLPHVQEKAKKSLEMVNSQISQELIKMNQKELSI